MDTTKTLTLYIILFFSASWLSAQEFQKAFTEFNVANDCSRDLDGNLYVGGYTSFMYDPALDEIVSFDILNKLNNQGEVLWSKDFEVTNSLTEIHKVLAMPIGDVIVLFSIDKLGEELKMGIARISSSGDIVWSQTLQIDIPTFDEFNTEVNLFPADGNNFFIQSKKINTTQQVHLLSKMDGSGNLLWNKSYTSDLKINTSNIIAVGENQMALIGHYTAEGNATNGLLVILDESGQIQNSKSFPNLEIQSVLPTSSDYMVKFKVNFNAHAGIMRLDNNLNLVWARELEIEVEGQLGNFEIFNDESVVMYVYNNRDRVELLTSYDLQGEQNWAKFIESKYSGRPFTEKVIDADGEILIMSNIWTTDLKSSIFRQLPLDGNAGQCILPIACTEDIPISVLQEAVNFSEGNPMGILNPINISLNTAATSTSDYCQEVSGVPSPVFDLDSTACVNELVEVFNTMNEGADNISWGITGGPEEAILPLTNLNNGLPIAFSDTGKYTITQYITYQDCVTSFDQETIISEGLPFAFAEDTLILCQDEIKTINANRPGFVSYLWLDDNSPDPIKKIDAPGTYTIELYDGSCTKSYDLVAENFDYSGIEFSLGPDTTVCEFRRFTLSADVIREGVDYIWNDGVRSGERFANKEGEYNLTVFLDGCDYTDDIFVTFEPCEPQVYVPNIFTPNADGFNDTLYPAGKNFELASFRIYNRWGALLHDDLSPWDGEYKNLKTNGVYIYNISFLNIRSGDIETKAGSFYLHK